MRTTIELALANLPSPLQEVMVSFIQSDKFDATISAEDFAIIQTQTQLSDQALRLALLPLAAAYAIVPLSNFYVGAIARGSSGRLYFGANIEFLNVGLNTAMHAEQSAISHAWLKGETAITDVTINYSPCGHCRQFMNELNQAEQLMIQLPNIPAAALSHFLPSAFGPNDLNIPQRLLTPTEHGFASNNTDELINAAIKAANKSYSPYSHNFCAVALKCNDGQIFVGMYAENAAFNPSLPPLQIAINSLNLANATVSQITDAVFVETNTAKSSYFADSKTILAAISPQVELRHFIFS